MNLEEDHTSDEEVLHVVNYYYYYYYYYYEQKLQMCKICKSLHEFPWRFLR